MAQSEMTPIESSHLSALGYDQKEKKLYVSFKTGATYVYSGVPREVYVEMLHTPSAGKYLYHIVRPRYGNGEKL